MRPYSSSSWPGSRSEWWNFAGYVQTVPTCLHLTNFFTNRWFSTDCSPHSHVWRRNQLCILVFHHSCHGIHYFFPWSLFGSPDGAYSATLWAFGCCKEYNIDQPEDMVFNRPSNSLSAVQGKYMTAVKGVRFVKATSSIIWRPFCQSLDVEKLTSAKRELQSHCCVIALIVAVLGDFCLPIAVISHGVKPW